ncbi:hypothetical protein EI94DRAFT_1703565 [Lactarius quietus]|nr:hypothetical protein EI94DRAFT_1703565 [Lactarius quietus]
MAWRGTNKRNLDAEDGEGGDSGSGERIVLYGKEWVTGIRSVVEGKVYDLRLHQWGWDHGLWRGDSLQLRQGGENGILPLGLVGPSLFLALVGAVMTLGMDVLRCQPQDGEFLH